MMRHHISTARMFHAMAVVSALHLLSEASMPMCNEQKGQVRFEKLPQTALAQSSSKADAIRLRLSPAEVLTRCAKHVMDNRTATQAYEINYTSFDFYPGQRITRYASPFPGPSTHTGQNEVEGSQFSESKCFIALPQTQYTQGPEYVNNSDSMHFREVCLDATAVRQCPKRLYVIVRLRNHNFVPTDMSPVPQATTIEQCQDLCLSQSSSRVCRAGTFNRATRQCFHSQYTRSTHPNHLRQDDSFDYFENTCLSDESRCPANKLMFVKEEKEIGEPLVFQVFPNTDLEECQKLCVKSEEIFCRRVEHEADTNTCVLMDEDSITTRRVMKDAPSRGRVAYEMFCVDGDHVHGEYVFQQTGEGTEQLNARRYRDVRTAFQLYRQHRLQLGSGFRGSKSREVTRVTLAECLDECLEERSFSCRSVSYSDRFQNCQLSEHDKLSGRLVYDADYHYFENLMDGQLTYPSGGGSGYPGGSSTGRYPPSGGSHGSQNCFEVKGERLRLRGTYVRDYLTVLNVEECKQRCLNARSYTCKSFNFIYASSRDNCQLSDLDTRSGYISINSPSHFDSDSTSDYYEASSYCGGGTGGGRDPGYLDVQQVCSPDGMEFTLRTDEGFRGRIYTYGYYDRCFSRGTGGTINVLKISGPRGFPDCGTSRYGETTTNIVVVQFSDNVQTSLDKRYNLTCTVVGPSESVVTSGYIGAGSGAPTPIEYLPAENQLQSRVKLQILYDGRPTTTIAVGDPLTFRLESQRGFNLVSDIFASNVVAKDPYSGRSVQLIDSRGCPVDNYVFPSLGKARDGDGLEARFNAFKIPESNFLIFEATVRNCRGGCDPARCTIGPGREETLSYGRKRRDAEEGSEGEGDEDEEEEQVHGIYEVYLSRDEIDESVPAALLDEVCVASSEYYSLVAALVTAVLALLLAALVGFYCFRRSRQLDLKNAAADAGNPFQQQQQQQQHKFAFPGTHARTLTQPASYFPSGDTPSSPQCEDGAARTSRYPDPSEPIYTDPALFERSHL